MVVPQATALMSTGAEGVVKESSLLLALLTVAPLASLLMATDDTM